MTARKLPGCPFCGSRNLFTTRDKDGEEKASTKLDNWQFICGECHARGPTCANIEDIRKGWDRRSASLDMTEEELTAAMYLEIQAGGAVFCGKLPWNVEDALHLRLRIDGYLDFRLLARAMLEIMGT